jgi:S24 (lexA) family peptidase
LGDEIVADQMADGTWRVRSSSGEILRGTTDEVIRHLRERAAPYEAGRDRTPDVNDYAWIPLYDVEVSAGGGRFFDGENVLTYLAFTKYSLRKQGLQPDMLACVRVSGDSMEPTIQSNDAVMIDMRQTTADSGIFVFRVGEVLYLKRLVREGAGVRVISDNDIYPSWLIQPGEDFQIVGKRVWHARWGE